MSSHREAPGTSQDPVADSTDLYAFVSPDDPGTVTMICNYIPLEGPAAGPNFYEFGDDVLYSLHISNKGTAEPDITYDFQFETQVVNPNTFLYHTGPIGSLGDLLQRYPHRRLELDRSRDRPRLAAMQHRATLHAGVPSAGGGRRTPSTGRPDRVCRPAGRRLLR